MTLQDYMREKIIKDGYLEVNTPAVMPKVLWEKSGHWSHYQKNMFPVMKVDDEELNQKRSSLQSSL